MLYCRVGASQWRLEWGTIDVFGPGAICLGGPCVVAPIELIKVERTNSTAALTLWVLAISQLSSLSWSSKLPSLFQVKLPKVSIHIPVFGSVCWLWSACGAIKAQVTICWCCVNFKSESIQKCARVPGRLGGSERWTPIHKSLLESIFCETVTPRIRKKSHFAWAKWHLTWHLRLVQRTQHALVPPQLTWLGLKDVDSGCLETLFGTSRSSHQRPKDASFLSIDSLKEGNFWKHAVKPFYHSALTAPCAASRGLWGGSSKLRFSHVKVIRVAAVFLNQGFSHLF